MAALVSSTTWRDLWKIKLAELKVGWLGGLTSGEGFNKKLNSLPLSTSNSEHYKLTLFPVTSYLIFPHAGYSWRHVQFPYAAMSHFTQLRRLSEHSRDDFSLS